MSRVLLRSAGLVLVAVMAAGRASLADAGSNATWLARLNFYRGTAGLPPVTEDPALSSAVWQHARYMVMHDVVEHAENRRAAWATPEGAAAAAVSNLAGSTSATEPDVWAVDEWMQAPFHAVGILDPALRLVGFGIFHAQKDRLQTAAGLDVIRGRDGASASGAYPVVWPADGATVPLTAHTSEYPSPLTSCPGYSAPAGLPLIVQLGPGESGIYVTRTALVGSEGPLEHCVFDGSTYRNHSLAEQELGRSVLSPRGAIVLLPRRPLRPGSRYRAVIDVNGRVVDWTFRIDTNAR